MYNEINAQDICSTGLLLPFGHYLTSACQQGSIAIALQHFLKRVNFKLPQVIFIPTTLPSSIGKTTLATPEHTI